MKTIRTALAVAALTGVLAGCSAGGGPTAGTPSAPATAGAATATGAVTPSDVPVTGGGAVGADEQAVEAVLRQYQGSIAAGDFATACSLNTTEASAQLVAAVLASGGQVGTCEEAFFAVFTQPGAAGTAAEAAATTTVDDVTIEGLNATITWTSTRQGQPRTDSATMQAIDGQWRLAGTA